jgi:hypothetical protein
MEDPESLDEQPFLSEDSVSHFLPLMRQEACVFLEGSGARGEDLKKKEVFGEENIWRKE